MIARVAPTAVRARIIDAIRLLGTQREVAPLLGVSVPTLQRLIAGTGPIHLDLLCRVHGATGLTFAQLLGEGASADQSITECIVAGLSTSRDYPLTTQPTKDAVADSINDGGILGLSLPLPDANDVIVIEASREDILGATALLSALADLKASPLICMPDEAKVHIEFLNSPWSDWKRATKRLLLSWWGGRA